LTNSNNHNWKKYIFTKNKLEDSVQSKIKISKKPKEMTEVGSPTRNNISSLEIATKNHLSPLKIEIEDDEPSVIEEVFQSNNDDIERGI
jgi:hypothetical protein